MAVSAARLPKWHEYYFSFFLVDKPISNCRIRASPQRRTVMNILEDTDTINAILNQLADEGTIEPMIEPIDDPNNLTDFWDWADVVGIVDEFAPIDDMI